MLSIKLQSFRKDLNKNTINKVSAKERRGLILSLSSLPVKINKITLLRSPHVDKRGREQIERRHYRQHVQLKQENGINAATFLRSIQLGTAVKISLR